MAPAQRQRQPAFWWQAVLILLPVAVLSAVGWYSLRQDKTIAHREAQDRAQTIATDLAPKLWGMLTNWPSSEAPNFTDTFDRTVVGFKVDEEGGLVVPPPFPPVPTPRPLDPAKLTEEQLRLWLSSQYCGGINRESEAAAIQACREFIGTRPPSDFLANGQYGLGMMLKDANRYSEAANVFESLTNNPDAAGESGVPLEPLARLRLLELAVLMKSSSSSQSATAIEEFYSNAVWHPTVLTPYLLQHVGATGKLASEAAARWGVVWMDFDLPRGLYAAAGPQIQPLPAHETSLLPVTVSSSNQTPKTAPAIENLESKSASAAFWFTSEVGLPAHRRIRFGGWPNERDWLAIVKTRTADRATRDYLCWPGMGVKDAISRLISRETRLPDYFGVRLDLAGKAIPGEAHDLKIWSPEYYFSKGTGGERKHYTGETASEVLASSLEGDPATSLRVTIYLTSPAALYRRQQARTFWFGLLIAVSTVAALIGLLTAWRAFVQQRLLGEMKSNFVSSVSHELRAPIASVRLLAESLERGKVAEPQKQQEYFGFIVQECRRLSSLIENVLDFSRIEQGRKQYEPEPTDLAALLRETVKLMEPYAAEKGVALSLELPQGDSTVSCELSVDGRAIQQALVNLIDNAVKHSPKDEKVAVRLEFGGAAPDTTPLPSPVPASASLLLSVEDHGPGIPPEEHERIFERFYRRGSELRRDTQGVGIGLSIVKHIVEAHNGRVLVRSAAGQGSKFTIQLPRNGAEKTKTAQV